MTEKYVCMSCGSETVNRRINDSRLAGRSEDVQVPAYCSDPTCENADPRNHALQWAKISNS